jgi:UDP-3-O-[3-hydroxymyristoyl] glucosamine N-acyltransferase
MELSVLAADIGARLRGDGQVTVKAVASLREAGPEDISFVGEARYRCQASQSKAAALIVPEDFTEETQAVLLFVPEVNDALEKVLVLFAPAPDVPAEGVHPNACVAETAKLGDKVSVGPHAVIADRVLIADGSVIGAGCYLGADVEVGCNCFLGPNVVINARCVLGDNVIIHGNSTIGTDGFGYRLVDGKHRKIPHIGIVVIEDDVEIGANSCVDRAKFGKTVVGRGTKVDNLVQIGHNVVIGEHCILVSQVGLGGSSCLGNYVMLGGQSAVREHVNIGDGAMIGAQAGMIQDVEAGAQVIGTPHRSVRAFFRQHALVQKLPEMDREIKQLRRRIEKIGSTDDHS